MSNKSLGSGEVLEQKEESLYGTQYLSDVFSCRGGEFVSQSIDLFCEILETKKVPPEVISEALETLSRTLYENDSMMGVPCNYDTVRKDRDKFYNTLRKDYSGRALFFHMEKYFPKDKSLEKTILARPIHGMLPRQVLQGLITAIKNCHTEKMVGRYDQLFSRIAKKYRNEEGGIVNLVAFANDGEVRSVAANMMRDFKIELVKMSEAKRKAWLINQIESSEAFTVMGRNLSDDEYQLILERGLELQIE